MDNGNPYQRDNDQSQSLEEQNNRNHYRRNNEIYANSKKNNGISKKTIATILVFCIVLSTVLGFAGGVASTRLIKNTGNSVNISTSNSNNYSEIPKTEVAAVTASVADSVVEITTEVVTTDNWMRQYITEGAGSGVIIDSNGYIITNNHVIAGAQKITVTLRNSSTYNAILVATDSKQDIALIKIEETNLQSATFGDSSQLQVGETAIAIGNPLGQLGGTVTQGIISALDREISIDGENMTLLQTDTAINPGNSGGGLFNANKEFIGLVVAKSSGSNVEGLGFAIPSNIVKSVVEELLEYGYVRGRVALKISLVDINSMQSALMHGLTQTGIYVSEVQKDSNAEKAGLQVGDKITAINSTPVSTTEEIQNILSNLKVGDQITITVQRNNETLDISFVLEEYTP